MFKPAGSYSQESSHDISPCELIRALNEYIDFFKSGNGEQSSNRHCIIYELTEKQ